MEMFSFLVLACALAGCLLLLTLAVKDARSAVFVSRGLIAAAIATLSAMIVLILFLMACMMSGVS